jgi:hypothetical protein
LERGGHAVGTVTEIKIATHCRIVGLFPRTVSSVADFFKMVNENGGVGGRRINFTRRTASHSFFGQLGTSTNAAIVYYPNKRRIPHLFLASPGANWSDYQEISLNRSLLRGLRRRCRQGTSSTNGLGLGRVAVSE